MYVMNLPSIGGPDRFGKIEVEIPSPKDNELLVRQLAVGVNYIDVYHRLGEYPAAIPGVIGIEGAGVVEKVGRAVTRFKVGDYIAYGGPIGAYAQYRVLDQDAAVLVPDDIPPEVAAAVILKGLTADALLQASRLKAGDSCVVWAAAGGVGSILCQWAKAKGANVIGIVGSREKAAYASEHGCLHVLSRMEEDIPAKVSNLTQGLGASVVFDGVGKDSVATSLQCLATRGMLVSYGNASGPPPPIDLLSLGRSGSFYVTRVVVFHYYQTPEALDEAAAAIFGAIRAGEIRVDIGQKFMLEDAALAHRMLEKGATVGSTILIPE